MKRLQQFVFAAFLVSSLFQATGCKEKGCTDPLADNYDPEATKDNGDCTYELYVLQGTMTSPRTLVDRFDDPNQPDYQLGADFSVQDILTIEPGVVIACFAATRLTVENGGTIQAIGTSSKRIRFIGETVGTAPSAGHWQGIQIETNTNNRFEYVDIYHAGTASLAEAAIMMGQNSQVSLDHCDIAYSATSGIYTFWQEVNIPNLSNTTFQHCAEYPLNLTFGQVTNIMGNNNFAATNGKNFVRLARGNEPLTFTWHKINTAYLIDAPWYEPCTANSDVSIEPGTDIRFEDGGNLLIEGVLTANGSGSEPIQFRGRLSSQGFGGSIILDAAGNTMNNVVIDNLGQPGGYEGAVHIIDGATLSASNTSFSNSGTWAIYLNVSGLFTDAGGNTFTNNASGNVGP